MKNLGLPEADLDIKQPQGVCQARCDELKGSPCMGYKGNIIRKEKVLQQSRLGLGVGMEALLVEEAGMQVACFSIT